MEVLQSVIAICRWFQEQNAINQDAQKYMGQMSGVIIRMTPVLDGLQTRGLDRAKGVLDNLWVCVRDAKRMYNKYRDGWKVGKFWVTPQGIVEKANTQTQKLNEAFQELSAALKDAFQATCV